MKPNFSAVPQGSQDQWKQSSVLGSLSNCVNLYGEFTQLLHFPIQSFASFSLLHFFFPLALHHYYIYINVNFILGVIVWINVPLGKCSSTCLRVQLLGHGLSETSALPGISQCFPKYTSLHLYEKCIRVLILSYITNTLYYVAL